MRHRIVILGTSLLAGIVFAAIASAGGHHGGGVAGTTTPCGDCGCGPRYWGPWHGPCDPCDACGRWRGCNGATQGAEQFAPWQLPPCRGFTRPADLGYTRTIGVCGEGEPCEACATCGPHHGRCWLRPTTWF